MFGINIHVLNRDEATELIITWIKSDKKNAEYVVTPNVDHVIQYQSNPLLKEAYANASLVVADGKPVVWASKLFRTPLPETIPGSDLLPDLLSKVCSESLNTTVFLLGAGPGIAEQAKKEIENRWKNVKVVGVYSPPFGFEMNPCEIKRINEKINTKKPDILVVGLGAPKQEFWTLENYSKLKVNVILCIGATIDFLAKEKNRAPLWIQKIGMEWAHRMLSEPNRLIKRYAINLILYPWLVLCELFKIRKRKTIVQK